VSYVSISVICLVARYGILDPRTTNRRFSSSIIKAGDQNPAASDEMICFQIQKIKSRLSRIKIQKQEMAEEIGVLPLHILQPDDPSRNEVLASPPLLCSFCSSSDPRPSSHFMTFPIAILNLSDHFPHLHLRGLRREVVIEPADTRRIFRKVEEAIDVMVS
jgi:hypothetical protein